MRGQNISNVATQMLIQKWANNDNPPKVNLTVGENCPMCETYDYQNDAAVGGDVQVQGDQSKDPAYVLSRLLFHIAQLPPTTQWIKVQQGYHGLWGCGYHNLCIVCLLHELCGRFSFSTILYFQRPVTVIPKTKQPQTTCLEKIAWCGFVWYDSTCHLLAPTGALYVMMCNYMSAVQIFTHPKPTRVTLGLLRYYRCNGVICFTREWC